MGQFHIGQKIWSAKTRLRQPPTKGSHPCPGLALPDVTVECGRTVSANTFLCSVCASALRAWVKERQPADNSPALLDPEVVTEALFADAGLTLDPVEAQA